MNFKILYRLVLLFCLSLQSQSKAIPARDYTNKEYFMVELANQSTLNDFIDKYPDFQYEHQARALDKYHVFSVNKKSENLPNLGNYNSEDHGLIKREDNELLDSLIDSGVKSIHMLPVKRIVKRAPVPISFGDADGYSFPEPDSDKPVDSSQLKVEDVKKEFGIDDPTFGEQWHIVNSNFPGHEVNVIPVWEKNITGRGVVTALVDDGLDYETKIE
ncbi:unnamed protein product [Ambrosiozyma monospora]|uniref:Unnamed protein product n=1 Tax=Ambrosiozyma monospora TaxID=43982 RepID=A0A9W6YT55_AMBMO|nr:unnamed protein product [Ambrosiozyma monospora]